MQIYICDDNVDITKQIHDYVLTFFSSLLVIIFTVFSI